jgi:hypothetical protein
MSSTFQQTPFYVGTLINLKTPSITIGMILFFGGFLHSISKSPDCAFLNFLFVDFSLKIILQYYRE